MKKSVRMKASSVVVMLSALAMLALGGCDRGSGSRVTLQLNWKPEPQFGGFFVAKEIAAKRGLEIDVVAGGIGTPTVQMVAAGKVAFAVVSADEVVVARSNGADVVALFAVYQTNPQALMTRASRGFRTIGDIFRHPGTVAMQRGLPYSTFLERKFGFDAVKIVPSPGGDLSVFRADPGYSMQCFVTSEPIAAKKAGLDPQTFLVAEAGYNPYTTVLVTRGDYRSQHAEIVETVTKATAEGWRAYLDDPSAANATMHALNPTMDEETFVASARAQQPLIETEETKARGLGLMTLERWQALVEQLVDLKQVDKAPAARDCFAWK
jgi:NitT/TauT family transport system substrate-binding protein